MTAAQLAYIRSKIGTGPPPTDEDLDAALTRLRTPEKVVLEILEGRYATMSASPAKFALEGDFSQDASANFKALGSSLAAARAAAGTGSLVVGQLVRSDRPR